MNRIVLIAMVILPWITIFFLHKHSLKRFMPATIFASLLVTIVFEIGHVYDWWRIEEKLFPWDAITSVPLVYGVFLVGTLWIFHYVYDKKFVIYIITNILTDAFYSFVFLKILISIGLYRLVNMGSLGIFLMMLAIAVIIYVYQRWQDETTK